MAYTLYKYACNAEYPSEYMYLPLDREPHKYLQPKKKALLVDEINFNFASFIGKANCALIPTSSHCGCGYQYVPST